jgi:hypothetical protein
MSTGQRWQVWSCVAALCVAAVEASRADDLVVNGYTYVAPSVYLTPPVVVYDPAMLIPAPTLVLPRTTYVVPAPVVYAEPAFVSQTVVPYDPIWNYGPVVGPVAYRQRAWVGRHGLEYKYQAYAPGRLAPVYTLRVDSKPNGVRIRERIR